MTISVQSVIKKGGGYKLILKCTIFCALLLSFLLLNATFISCAGGAGSTKGSEAEGTSLAIHIPDTSRTIYEKEDIVSFTVTVSSGSFKSTKSANKGETMMFSNLPVGNCSVKAYGKTSSGNIAAKCDSSVTIVAGETTTTTLHLSRLEYCTVKFFNGTTEISSVQVTNGYKVAKPADPTKTGMSFLGWYASSDGGTTLASTAYDFDSTPVTDNIALYAAWGLTVSLLSDYLANLPEGSKSSPNVLPEIKGLTTSNWTQIKTALQANNTKFVDLSATTLPNGISNMEEGFKACNGLVTAPVIPSSVTSLESCFSFCHNLTSVPVIPYGVTNMWYCFYECTSLTTSPEIPASVTNMDSTFEYCSSLTTAPVIPSGVTTVAYCFDSCTSLTAAPVIPADVTTMSYCFHKCTSLSGNVVVNASITGSFYWRETFSEITSLSSIRVYVPDTGTRDALRENFPTSTGLNVSVGHP